MRSVGVVSAAVLLVACTSSGAPHAPEASPAPVPAPRVAPGPAKGDCIPTGWVPSEMIASDAGEAIPAGSRLEASVLAWRTKEDERPLFVESAIVRVEVKEADGAMHWVLLHVFRHPKEKDGYANVWRLAQIADTPVTGIERYRAAPTRAEIEEFMRDHDWDSSAGFRETGAGVCRDAWPA